MEGLTSERVGMYFLAIRCKCDHFDIWCPNRIEIIDYLRII